MLDVCESNSDNYSIAKIIDSGDNKSPFQNYLTD